MAKREGLVNLKKGETENGFSRHVLHECPPPSYERSPSPSLKRIVSAGKGLSLSTENGLIMIVCQYRVLGKYEL